MTDATKIEIKLPLPLDVAATLMNLVGSVYPGTMIQMNHHGYMALEVQLEDRVPDGDIEAFLAGFNPELLDPDAGVTMLTESGFSAPEWLARIICQVAEVSLEGAENYIEAPFTLHGKNNLVLTVARSEQQTPHALRMQALDRIQALEDKLHELGCDPSSV